LILTKFYEKCCAVLLLLALCGCCSMLWPLLSLWLLLDGGEHKIILTFYMLG
jgi:hypothetical protein